MVGEHMSHYIVPRGRFHRAFHELKAAGFKLVWQDRQAHSVAPAGRTQTLPGRRKFRCTKCGLNAWARPSAALVCGGCGLSME